MSNKDMPMINKAQPSLLAELAGEATSKLKSIQAKTQDQEARSKQLDASLNRIFIFLQTFAGYVNNITPIIQRAYNIDPNTTYGSLKWQNASADYRKQSLSDTALLDHVSFGVRLQAPEPVLITRRWNQIDVLKHELEIFGLRSLDDLDMLVRNKPVQENFSASLAPDFLLRIIFQGNYSEGMVDISARNFDNFGSAAFRLKPEEVTNEFLDDLGRFLIGRADDMPLPLKLSRYMPRR